MQYTKQDAKYIFGTFLVLFISMILNFTISIPLGEVVVGLNVGLIFGAIFTMVRLRRYLASKSVMVLYVLLAISAMSFLFPLCFYSLLSDLGPQLEFVSSLLIKPTFTPDEFNSMVESISSIQGNLLLITSMQTLSLELPVAAVLISIVYILEEVGESCNLKATKKVKKNYVIAAISLLITIMFIIIIMKYAFGVLTYLHMEPDGSISEATLEDSMQLISVLTGVSFLVLISIVVYIVFFIRGLVIMNRAAKELDHFPHQDIHNDSVDNDFNDNQE